MQINVDMKDFVFEQYDPSKQRKASTSRARGSDINKNKKEIKDGDNIVIFACKMCRLHHKRCSGERPCERCIQKNYTCENLVRMGGKKTLKESPPPSFTELDAQSMIEKMFEYMTEEHAKLPDIVHTEYVSPKSSMNVNTLDASKASIQYILN
jgi:hypothetical protein